MQGDRSGLARDKFSAAVSTELAEKVFNTSANALGKTIKWDQQEFGGTYVINGVFKKNPSSATDQFDLLFNYELVLERRPNLLKWGNSDPHTYVLLKTGTDVTRVNEKVRNFLKSRRQEAGHSLFLARFSDKYLYGRYENGSQSGGRIAYVKLFSMIAIFILVIACINFMNLSTAKAAGRSKEVGIKKVMGAGRSSLVVQYISESMLMTLVSVLVAFILIILLLPVFNVVTGKHLSLHSGPSFLLPVLVVTLVTGLVAGSYPAFYIAAFNPVTVLKGKLNKATGELFLRKGLVVFQFAISIVFIAAVLIVFRQLNFIQSKNLGYDRENIIHFEIPLEQDSAKIVAAARFVDEVKNMPGVINSSSYYHNLTGDHGAISDFDWPGKDPKLNIEFSNLEVGQNFLETAGIKIKDGRGFSPNARAEDEIIFNETAIKSMGLRNPVGKTIKFWGMEKQIVGIAADFNFESLYQPVKPCFFRLSRSSPMSWPG